MLRLVAALAVALGVLAGPGCTSTNPSACVTDGRDSLACYCETNPENCQSEPDTARQAPDATR
ncbi:MAG: hypothetical protein AAF845_07870 [Bacteroidota bacterium]